MGIFSKQFLLNKTVTVKLTINPTPSSASVTLTAQGYTQSGSSISVPSGTSVSYSVSAAGYTTKTGTWTNTADETLNIMLDAETSTCVPYYANILVDNKGTYKKPADICAGGKVLGYNLVSKQTELTEVIDIHAPVRNNNVVITYIDDSSIEVTNDHAVLTNEGWAAFEPDACQEVDNVIELSSSQKVLQADLTYKQIKSVEYISKPDGIQCYAINTGCDTFITEQSVVHNCGFGEGGDGWGY